MKVVGIARPANLLFEDVFNHRECLQVKFKRQLPGIFITDDVVKPFRSRIGKIFRSSAGCLTVRSTLMTATGSYTLNCLKANRFHHFFS